jgi:hypothetical protein
VCCLHGFRWRFGIGWWLVLLFGLPVIALLLGLTFGGLMQTVDLGLVLIEDLRAAAGDQTTQLDRAGRGGDQSVGGNGMGWFSPNPLEARFNFVLAAPRRHPAGQRQRSGSKPAWDAGVGRLSKWRPRDSRLKRSAPC